MKWIGFAAAVLMFSVDAAAARAYALSQHLANAVRIQHTRTDSPQMEAVRVESAVTIDGQLDEPDWARAQPASGFVQSEPLEGRPATQPSQVHILYGEHDLYVGATLYDDRPDRIQQTLGRRDEYVPGDWFAISIDSHHDRKTAFQFAVSAAGVQYDALRAEDVDVQDGPAGGGDISWNAIWESAVRVTPDGWVVEIRIPYSMLRFSQAPQQIWGIHFSREIQRLGERSEWPLVPRNQRANLVAGFGTLHGISGIEPRRDVQITPYTLSNLKTRESSDDPGRLSSRAGVDAGADLKIGLGSNVTLNATINPDFGQVESDPAELNLTAFETFFDEKRPFFVEGMQIYRFPLIGNSSLLYTRRIGADAPIIGAAKLSGRTAGGLSFGFLAASTGEDFEPGRHYGVARVSQQFGQYSSLGGMLTGVGGTSLDDRPGAMTGGADWDFRFRENTYSLRGFTAFSHRVGEETGFTGQIMAARRQGTWTYEFGGDFVDDRFDPNDVGRQQRNNAAGAIIRFGYNVNGGRGFGPFQRAEVEGSTWQQWSYAEGIRLRGSASAESEWVLTSFERISIEAGISNPFGGYDLFETRGLWPARDARSLDFAAAFRTDDRRDWFAEPSVNFTFQDDGGRIYTAGVAGSWNVRTQIALSGELEMEWGDGTVEWAANESFRRGEQEWQIGSRSVHPANLDQDEWASIPALPRGMESFFGRVPPDPLTEAYYVPVYGARDTRAVDLTLRASYTFTPDLVLQLYSQIFTARGRYEDFRILFDPDTKVPFDGYPKRYEFTTGSFHLNSVLRWEYRPGSVLYIVWTQERVGDAYLNPLGPWNRSPYDASVRDQIADTFSLFPGNVFMVKLSYTFLR